MPVAAYLGIPMVCVPVYNFGIFKMKFSSTDSIYLIITIIAWTILSFISGGKLLLEMNRILRPGGYFIMSTKHDSIEEEEGLSQFWIKKCTHWWNKGTMFLVIPSQFFFRLVLSMVIMVLLAWHKFYLLIICFSRSRIFNQVYFCLLKRVVEKLTMLSVW